MKVLWRGYIIRNAISRQIINKAIAIASIAVVLFSLSGQAYADQFDEQIRAAQAEAARQQSEAHSLHAQAKNYQEQVAQYNAQINIVRAQIRLNQAKSNKVAAQIEDAKSKLADQKAILAENIKTMYLASNVTPIEMLASSNNLSQYFDQQQYHDKVKTKIQNAMAEVVALKADLEKQQHDLDRILATARTQEQELATTQAQLSSLMAIAQQSAAAADQQVKEANAKVTNLKAQQAAALAAKFTNNGLTTGGTCGGGYPASAPGPWGPWGCNYPKDNAPDRWGMYNRECVSYTAFRVAASGRYMPYWGGSGHAWQWPGNASRAGINVDFASNPKVGDVAIIPKNDSAGIYYGHAMYVEAVLPGNRVHVSQYNWSNNGEYSEMTISISGIYFIHF